jgi:uncharacterized membrane protein
MTFYELLLALHVIVAIIWLGSGFVIALLIFGAKRAGDAAKEASLVKDVEWLAPRLFIPSSLATVIVGFLLVAEGSWDLGQAWISFGLAGWLFSFGIGIGFFKPQSELIAALAEQHGPDYPEVVRRAARITVLERFQLMVLFLVAADMVIKPTGDDTGVLIAGAAILGAGLAYVLAALRSVDHPQKRLA